MKLFVRSFLSSLLFLFFLPSTQAAETYQLDPKHTQIIWHINHLGFSNPSGKWIPEGTLIIDEKNPENSKVNATIKINELITGIPDLDKHLKSKDFFDTEKFPTATFVSNKISVTGKDTAKVDGKLTIRGISKPIILNVKFNKKGISPINNKLTIGFSATAELKRSDFGINAFLPALGDEVKLNIEAEGIKKEADQPKTQDKSTKTQ